MHPQPVCKQMNNCPEYEPEQKKPVRFAAWYLVQTSTKYLPVLPQLWQPMHSRRVRDLGPGAVQTMSGSTGKTPSQGCNTAVNLSDFFQAFPIRLKKGRKGREETTDSLIKLPFGKPSSLFQLTPNYYLCPFPASHWLTLSLLPYERYDMSL